MSAPETAPAASPPDPPPGRAELARVHDRYGPIPDRVAALLKSIEAACGLLEYRPPAGSTEARRELGGWLKSYNDGNESYVESFIASLLGEFPGRAFEVRRGSRRRPITPEDAQRWDAARRATRPAVVIERQQLSRWAVRTTRFNYVFTVPGESEQAVVLVAHYDTWLGPGADDNTTGEEIVKQYLIEDLRAPKRPPLTHTYILAGSEECGLIGFASQVVLGVSLGLANIALTHGLYAMTALGLALAPLAGFRFGVSGSREYVASLSAAELALVKSVVAVDSVGEGRMYIPETSLGASFVGAFFPYPGYEQLNLLLQEGAHLHGIKYNTFIAGGTTDHISFLEVTRSWRDRLGNLLGCPRWLGCHRQGKRRIPASALVALLPGKASPLVFGGKIHTPHDTADRVYPEPLAQALRILDYWWHLLQGGTRIAEPRDLDEYHYAQLYAVRRPGAEAEHWLALKDAVEPNRRNLNAVYRVALEERDGVARCRPLEAVGWGVETQLDREVRDLSGGRCRRLEVARLDVLGPEGTVSFAARPGRTWARVQAGVSWLIGRLEGLIGTHSFVAFFGAAFLLARVVELVMMEAFRWEAFQKVFFDWFYVTLPLTLVAQVMMVVYLVAVRMPHLADQSYAHMNRADNLSSLRRTRSHDA